MITSPRTLKAIDIFLDAINQGTLAKSSCCACAVGNLVANGLNATFRKTTYGIVRCDQDNFHWSSLFVTNDHGQSFNLPQLQNPKVLANIEATDFTYQELMKIEYAFETNTKISETVYFKYSAKKIREDQLKGLEAVVKVMLELDDSRDDVNEIFTSKVKALELSH